MQEPTLVPTTDRIDCKLTRLDIQLLELLAQENATRRLLAKETAEQASWVGKRLERLIDHGIVDRPDRGLYHLPWEYRRRGDHTVVVEPDETARMIRDHLRTRKDLVPDEYLEAGQNPLSSLCYVASEAYYYAKGKPESIKPQRIEWADGSSHWFLRDESVVLDLSLEEPDPWLAVDEASGRMFPSHPYPSNRTKDVLERLDLAPGVIADD